MTFPLDLTETTKLLAQELVDSSKKSLRVDCHTHIQGDIFNFTRAMVEENLIGSQAPGLHKYPDDVIEKAIKSGRLVRRTMMDAVPGYSWFVQLALGQGADFYDISGMDRKNMGRALVKALQPCRYSERAGWLSYMLSRCFGSRSIARMVESMVWESSIKNFAGGISDARYITMIGAKGESIRNGLATGLALCVSQGRLPMKVARQYMNDVLYINPAMVHNIPLDELA